MHRYILTGLAVVLASSLLQACSPSPQHRYQDPHAVLNPESDKEIRELFSGLRYESSVQSATVSNSEWIVVSAYPYRALNRFDVYVFEHPAGGVPGYHYGYYLRAFFVAEYSQTMKIGVEPDGEGLRLIHDGATLGVVGHLNPSGPSASGGSSNLQGGANGRLPSSSETNRTPPAAASRRSP